MPRLAMLRHGHTAWNRQGRIQGAVDEPLDGAARAELAGYRLPRGWCGADLVSSPLCRAVETARLVAGEPQEIDCLREMSWGAWEGARGVDLIADAASGYRHIEEWGWDFTPPDGESVRAVRDRVLPWLLGLKADTVAVVHMGVMRVVLAEAFGWNFEGEAPFAVKRNRLFVVDVAESVSPAEPLIERLERVNI